VYDPFDFQYDRDPAVQCAGPGVWRVVWGTQYDLGAALGGDYDLMISTGTLTPDGDRDADGRVDLDDFAGFQECFAPAGPAAIGCFTFDFEGDDDVDLDDFRVFEGMLAGPQG
jgi:hypothetical protein